MIRRPYRHQRARTQLTPSQAPPPPSILPTLTINATKARLSFSAPVVVNGLPISITRQAAGVGAQLAPTAYTVIDAQTLDLTYAAAVVTTDVVTVPANVPQIRGCTGGPVAATVKTF